MNEYVETVQHMIDWIENNLDQTKVLEKLSRVIGYSPWYCEVWISGASPCKALIDIFRLHNSLSIVTTHDGQAI